MMFRTIRSRLALSFAGIALVAALALGAVLLAILRNYYLNQELDYLRGNAQAIGDVVVAMMSANASQDELQPQIENLAFLSQTRIQVYSLQGQMLYDSGSPQDVKVDLGVVKQTFIQTNDAFPKDMVFISVGGSQVARVSPDTATIPSPSMPRRGNIFVYRSVQAGGSPFGFNLKLNSQASPVTARSNLMIMEMLRDPRNNNKLGSLELSEGPAYGSAILTSVARGWALASTIAVLLAAAIGWYISRRISAPVLALTEVTARMAQGELSSRAEIRSRDEFGQLARSFNDMAGRVEDTVSALRAFVADAAHELHTPLTALHTNLELAADEKKASTRTLYLSRAQEQGQRLEALVNGLLDLSRLESGRSAESREKVNLTQLLQELAESFASRVEQMNRVFQLSLPAHAMIVEADANQIQRAVQNLLQNSLKFTDEGDTIHLSLEQEEDEAFVTVSDNGIGIPPEDLPQIFSRFHRGHNASHLPGSGLGLAIVKAIVDAHGGHVGVQSKGTGHGSVFKIGLPLSKG